jgi:hypothetical protein
MKMYGEWRYGSTIIDLGIRWRKVASHFTPGERVSSAEWIGGWEGPRTSLDVMEKRNNLAPTRNLNLSVQPVAHCYTPLS